MTHDTGKQTALGCVLVVSSALAWSTAGIFTKSVEADVCTVLLWRGLLAGGVMSAWLVWRRGQAGLADWKHLGWAGWSAATVSITATICFLAAFKNTTVANVAIIYATAPFAAAAIAVAEFGVVHAAATVLLAEGVLRIRAAEAALLGALEVPLVPLWSWLISPRSRVCRASPAAMSSS